MQFLTSVQALLAWMWRASCTLAVEMLVNLLHNERLNSTKLKEFFKNLLLTHIKSVSHIAYELLWWFESWDISNGNWTEWSTIQGVIARVVSKSDEREERGRFEITNTVTR